ncbi:hypothetical protein V8D89_006814 [Ganoderma adspersum]
MQCAFAKSTPSPPSTYRGRSHRSGQKFCPRLALLLLTWRPSLLRSLPEINVSISTTIPARAPSLSTHNSPVTIDALAPTHLTDLTHLSNTIYDLLKWLQSPRTHPLTLHASHTDPTQLMPSPRAYLQAAATTLRLPSPETLSAHSTRTTRSPIWGLLAVLDAKRALMAAVESLLTLRHLLHLTLDLRLFIDVETVDGWRARKFESIDHFPPTVYPTETHPLRDLDVKEVVFPREADL